MQILRSALLVMAIGQYTSITFGEDVDCVKFVATGDWGYYKFEEHGVNYFMNIAAGIDGASSCKSLADGALLLGDNFYDYGVRSAKDRQWKTKYQRWFDVEKYPNLNIPMLAITGNHDYWGNAKAQNQYKDPTKRWYFPTPYYTRKIVKGSVSVFFIMLDTWKLIGGDTPNRRFLREGTPVDSFSESDFQDISSPEDKRRLSTISDTAQFTWLENQLASTDAQSSDWIIVCGHYEMFSPGSHGDVPVLIENLQPLLEKYKVDAYFHGHDHIQSLIKKGNVYHYLNGNGGNRDIGQKKYKDMLFTLQNARGFMTHTFTKDSFTTTFHSVVDFEEKIMFTFTQNPAGRST